MVELVDTLDVRDHIPLEQGLRRDDNVIQFVNISQRPYSIRTRIKTT